MKLKLFADRAYLPESDRCVAILYPFWGIVHEADGSVDAGRFEAFAKAGDDIFSLATTLAEADVAVLPFEWRSKKQWGDRYDFYLGLASRLAQEAAEHGRRVIVFFNNDSDEAVPVENAIIFRTSFGRSTRRPNEFALPGWSVDFLHRYLDGRLSVRPRVQVPTVGYCGYVDYDPRCLHSMLMYGVRRLAGRKVKIGAALRGRAVRALRRERGIRLNFRYRSDFRGGCGEEERLEYVRNMADSDYALVTRGAGNFSYRLYEVLSCGRIPVFVDTDCVLPFDHLIDWKRYCVWVDVKDIDSLGARIVEFHGKVSPKEFEELQVAIRRLYEEWISPVGFHKNLWQCIMSR